MELIENLAGLFDDRLEILDGALDLSDRYFLALLKGAFNGAQVKSKGGHSLPDVVMEIA